MSEARTCRLPPRSEEADDLQSALRAWADALARVDALRERVEHQRRLLDETAREHEAAKTACLSAQRVAERMLKEGL